MVDFFKDFAAFGFPAMGFGVEVALCEAGFIAASKIGGVGEAVTYTERGEHIRLTSARRAEKHEQDHYYRENSI
jgi:hypothetical protein